MKPSINFVLLFILTYGSFSSAYSYIDMGTGSYVLQIVLASVFGGLYALKIYWKRIILFFKSRKNNIPVEDNIDHNNKTTS